MTTNFLERLSSLADESEIYHYEAENKKSSTEFTHPSSTDVRIFKTQSSWGKPSCSLHFGTPNDLRTSNLRKKLLVLYSESRKHVLDASSAYSYHLSFAS